MDQGSLRTVKIKKSSDQELQKGTINWSSTIFADQKSWSCSQTLQQATYKWLFLEGTTIGPRVLNCVLLFRQHAVDTYNFCCIDILSLSFGQVGGTSYGMSAIYMEEMRSQWIKHPRSQRDSIVQKVGVNNTLSPVLRQVPFTLCMATSILSQFCSLNDGGWPLGLLTDLWSVSWESPVVLPCFQALSTIIINLENLGTSSWLLCMKVSTLESIRD